MTQLIFNLKDLAESRNEINLSVPEKAENTCIIFHFRIRVLLEREFPLIYIMNTMMLLQNYTYL
jgi:hypothetical protein